MVTFLTATILSFPQIPVPLYNHFQKKNSKHLAVPLTEQVLTVVAVRTEEQPKSATLTLPSPEYKRLSGLISLQEER